MKQIGVGVVGYGMSGEHHCSFVNQVEELKLEALCEPVDVLREKAKGDHGMKTYTSLEEMLEDAAIELVVLSTPHHTHAPMAIQVLEAGRHVMVEKVMCLNVQEADDMMAAAKKAGRTLTVYHNRRLDGDYLTARKVIESGDLGEVYRIEVACNYYGPHTGWRTKMHLGGGFIYDGGSHIIDQVVQMAGCRAKTVFADIQRRVWTDTMDTDTASLITVRFESGLVAVFDISSIAWHKKHRWLMLGEKGSFMKQDWEEDPGYIETRVADLPARIEVEAIKRDWLPTYQKLADHLLNGEDLWVKPEEVRETVKIIQGAFESDKTGQSVEILDW